jgi:hypothetical protein
MSTQHAAPRFDVFLSHNSKDKAGVRELRDQLTAHGLCVWHDEDELRTGIPLQQFLEAGIHASYSVVVVVGRDGLGPWVDEEMRAALTLAAKDRRAIIPVLLPGSAQPELPLFLRNRTWVDLGAGVADEANISRLIWSITGRKTGCRPRAKHSCASLASPESAPLQREAPAPFPPLALETILPGNWQIRIQTPFAQGNMQLVLTTEGSFHGELIGPRGASVVEGQWQAINPARKIELQGRQSAGFRILPYYALVEVTFFDAQQIVGITAAGEQVTWHKLTPAA